MKDEIRTVRAMRATLPLPVPLQVGPMRVDAREYAAVRVETQSGLIGKAYCLTRNAPVAECVDRLVGPIVLGADSQAVADRWNDCFRGTLAAGRVGLVIRAIGLVDIALWDIAAQRAGVPLWSLLGGGPDPVPAMMVTVYPIAGWTTEALVAEVVRQARNGHALLKIGRDPEPVRMRRLLMALTTELDESCRLVVDAAFAWSNAADALRELAAWGPAHLAWLEDPIVPEDVAGYSAIKAGSTHPIGVGDELSDPRVFACLIERRALDLLRLDVVAVGGISAARHVMQLAQNAGLPVSFHVYPEVTVHLAATMPTQASVEHFDSDPDQAQILDQSHLLCHSGISFARGCAVPPSAPGLGFDLDWCRFDYPGQPPA